MDLYIIVGCETTTIYSISLDGHDVSILCLEEINGNIDNLKMLLAHEYTHYVRKSILQKDIFESCIGERLVTEGIAETMHAKLSPEERTARTASSTTRRSPGFDRTSMRLSGVCGVACLAVTSFWP